jgi:hypothetical protein
MCRQAICTMREPTAPLTARAAAGKAAVRALLMPSATMPLLSWRRLSLKLRCKILFDTNFVQCNANLWPTGPVVWVCACLSGSPRRAGGPRTR